MVLGGDYNVIPEPLDATTRRPGWATPCSSPRAARAFRALMHLGLTEAFRALHPDERGAYTFWDYQGGALQLDHGIRIDHLLLSPQAADRLVGCAIDKDPRAPAQGVRPHAGRGRAAGLTAQKPSRTILPLERPLSISAWARFRLTALMVPKLSVTVVVSTPASTRSATSFKSSCWAAMSSVSNSERVNMSSQWVETDLRLNGTTSNATGSSISAEFALRGDELDDRRQMRGGIGQARDIGHLRHAQIFISSTSDLAWSTT